MSTIHVASAISKHYLLPFAVLLDSLTQTLRSGHGLVCHLLHRDLDAADLRLLGGLVDLDPIRVGDVRMRDAPYDARFPPVAAFPLLLADVLPHEIQRVLFLDADMLVMDDVGPLWGLTLDGHAIAAAQDGAIPLCSSPRGVKGWRESGIPRETPYFNGGMLLIDLPVWRAHEVTRRVHDYLRRNRGNVDFLHQEALNAVLWRQRLIVDPRWNLLASRAGRPSDRAGSEAWLRPGIVHFSGRVKPWRSLGGGPFQEPYRKVMNRVSVCFPADPPTITDRLQGFYDRRCRDALYRLEEFCWRMRWL